MTKKYKLFSGDISSNSVKICYSEVKDRSSLDKVLIAPGIKEFFY